MKTRVLFLPPLAAMLVSIGGGSPAAAAPAAAATSPLQAARPVRAGWNFKFKKFVIGAWWGPGPTAPELKLYRDAGFNILMCGRYMEPGSYGDPNSAVHELALARKYGLGAMFDTYTKNDRPWGNQPGPFDPHPMHHPANLAELRWLYGKIGHNPALVGFMIGDDQGGVSKRAAECTAFLHSQPGKQLFPWLCGWISPDDLARHNNPIEDPQIYPTLYQWNLPAVEQARQYVMSYAELSRRCQELGILFWPMFNSSADNGGDPSRPAYMPSDSLLRFPAYAALAFGAQGIWYFIYNGGAIEKEGHYRTAAQAQAALTPLYPVSSRINRRIAAWGPRVLERTSAGVFSTAFQPAVEWPFPADGAASPNVLAQPGTGKLIESMGTDLLVGVLAARGKDPVLMVVDCRVSKSFADLPSRQVSLHLNSGVQNVRVLEGRRSTSSSGRDVTLTLEPGGGQLIQLSGKGLAGLCTPSAIHAPPVEAGSEPTRSLTDAELSQIKDARLRIDVFGSDSRPPYNEKYIELNGHRIGRVPSNDSDTWSLGVLPLTAEERAWIHPTNEISIRNEGGDAWKFRNLSLAVQLASGEWVRTPIQPEVHSSPNWVFTEGAPWAADGSVGPVEVNFGPGG